MFEPLQEETRTEPRTDLAGLLQRAGLGGVPRGAALGAAALAVIALAAVGWRLGGAATAGEFAYEETDPTEGAETAAVAELQPGAGDEAADAGPLWVHVAGEVRAPGLYQLAAGARVGDAVEAAGGPGPEAALDAVNLARVLGDGEQVYVPSGEEVAQAGALSPGGAASGVDAAAGVLGQDGAGAVDINRASIAELETLPGVGPSTAAKIAADREANGPFTAPEDIMRVPGIGEKKFEAMRDMIVVR